MVSPGQLRLVTELADGATDAFRPTIDDDDTVVYPEAEEPLDTADPPPREVLETLAAREVLVRDFEDKLYLCPDCGADGMRYTSACPECASPHIVRHGVVECDDCNRVGSAEAFERDGDLVCPNCERNVGRADGATRAEGYVCQNCGEGTEEALHALKCPDDGFVCHPTDAIERVLYRYGLGEHGERWLDEQLQARQTVGDTFADRGYAVEEDVTVTGASGEEHRLHLYASDDLLEERLVAGVHELASVDDVARLRDAADDVEARPLLVTTMGTVSEQVAERAERDDVTILSVRERGEISREFEVTEDLGEDRSLIGRLTTVLS